MRRVIRRPKAGESVWRNRLPTNSRTRGGLQPGEPEAANARSEACYSLGMAHFLPLHQKTDWGDEVTSALVNLDRIRAIDEIRPGHCRVVFAPDHAIPVDGPAAEAFLESVSRGGERAIAPAPAAGELPYVIQIRDSPDSEWRDVGPADDSYIGVTCGELMAANQCPGHKDEGRHVRVVDASGKTIWMVD
jgi:hypothetical protein